MEFSENFRYPITHPLVHHHYPYFWTGHDLGVLPVFQTHFCSIMFFLIQLAMFWICKKNSDTS